MFEENETILAEIKMDKNMFIPKEEVACKQLMAKIFGNDFFKLEMYDEYIAVTFKYN